MALNANDYEDTRGKRQPLADALSARALNKLSLVVVRLAVVSAAVVLIVYAGSQSNLATSLVAEYAVRAGAAVLMVAAGLVWLGIDRRRLGCGYVTLPLTAGVIAATALASSLAGVAYAPGGIGGDQSFRTAAVARFSETWHNADFAVKGLPSFYPPAYFWILGRVSAIMGIAPWEALKFGAIATALAVPVLSYALWRRLVSDRVAALVALVILVVEDHYEPYSWLVLSVFVPWWVAVVAGVDKNRGRRAMVGYGAVAALMAMTYWYLFAIGAIGLVITFLVERYRGVTDRDHWRWTTGTLGVAMVGSAIYWLPVVVSVLRAPEVESLGNRWFNTSHPKMELPMFDFGAVGLVALFGFCWMAYACRRKPIARALAVLLTAAYLWYAVGALAVVADHPLLSFRGKPMISMVLLSAGVLGLVEMANAMRLQIRADGRRVVAVLAVAFSVFVVQAFIDTVSESPYTAAARDTPPPEQGPGDPPPAELARLIDERVGVDAVLVTARTETVSLYGDYTFVPWNAHYANPAAEFHARLEFLDELAASGNPADFRRLLTDNRFGPIDALLLHDDGDMLTIGVMDDAFPNQTVVKSIAFPRRLFDGFELIDVGEHVLAIAPYP